MLLRFILSAVCVIVQLVSSNPHCGSLHTHTWVLAAIPPYLPHKLASLLGDFLQPFRKQQHKYFFLYSSKMSSLNLSVFLPRRHFARLSHYVFDHFFFFFMFYSFYGLSKPNQYFLYFQRKYWIPNGEKEILDVNVG